MQRYLRNESVLKECKIYEMLLEASKKAHLSFHTPGHKNGAWDITELSFSDNLSSPNGCILEAEKDIARILRAKKSFILTDGSTSGVLSMLYAVKSLGASTVAVDIRSHKSVFNGCKLLGLTPLIYENEGGMYAFTDVFTQADVLFFTSPNYYGKIPPLKDIRDFCDKNGKWLLIDGAHGGHLHFDKEKYAGSYADLWVDGVHKSLPAFTQGAVVSARTEALAEKLKEGVDIFRTTSPSYPIMASVEYAVKYPRAEELERAAWALQSHARILNNDDWTKICAQFGEASFSVQKLLEEKGIFAEFCDGEYVVFYLSPATTIEEMERLKSALFPLFEIYPYAPKKVRQRILAPLVSFKEDETEWVEIEKSAGKICALDCGLFPPCTPLLCKGERVTKEKIDLLQKADNLFGVREGKMLVAKDFASSRSVKEVAAPSNFVK